MVSPDNNPSILIAESDKAAASELAGQLKAMGYVVAGIAADSKTTVEMTDHLRPQLVLMDMDLGGEMNGILTAHAIQKRQSLPVIYVADDTAPAAVARVESTTPFGYIVRPIDEHCLAIQIELVLNMFDADRRLNERDERYRSLFENNHAVMLLVNPQDGGIIDANTAACNYYGYPLEKITKLCISDINILPQENVKRQIQLAASHMKCHFYFQHQLADGHIRDVEVFSGPITIEGQKLLYSIVHDITARRQAEAALQRMNETLEQQVVERTKLADKRAAHIQTLAVELIRTEERERQRIAQLLHDDLQQILAAAKLQLESLCENTSSDSPLEKVSQWLMEAVHKTRHLSHELSTAALKASSLETGLQWICKKMKTQFDLAVNLNLKTTRSFENELLKVFVLRGVRELLFNVVKHADVNQADIVVLESDNCLVVRVSDSGRGFDPTFLDAAEEFTGMGLFNLRQRARYIRGDLLIDSSFEKGSRIELIVPFETGKADARRH